MKDGGLFVTPPTISRLDTVPLKHTRISACERGCTEIVALHMRAVARLVGLIQIGICCNVFVFRR